MFRLSPRAGYGREFFVEQHLTFSEMFALVAA